MTLATIKHARRRRRELDAKPSPSSPSRLAIADLLLTFENLSRTEVAAMAAHYDHVPDVAVAILRELVADDLFEPDGPERWKRIDEHRARRRSRRGRRCEGRPPGPGIRYSNDGRIRYSPDTNDAERSAELDPASNRAEIACPRPTGTSPPTYSSYPSGAEKVPSHAERREHLELRERLAELRAHTTNPTLLARHDYLELADLASHGFLVKLGPILAVAREQGLVLRAVSLTLPSLREYRIREVTDAYLAALAGHGETAWLPVDVAGFLEDPAFPGDPCPRGRPHLYGFMLTRRSNAEIAGEWMALSGASPSGVRIKTVTSWKAYVDSGDPLVGPWGGLAANLKRVVDYGLKPWDASFERRDNRDLDRDVYTTGKFACAWSERDAPLDSAIDALQTATITDTVARSA